MHIWSRLTLRWSQLVFGTHFEKLTPKVRMLRLLEEVMELAQSEDVTVSEVSTIANQVFSKPKNMDIYSELGGVLVTMAVYAAVKNVELDHCFFTEFERIMDPRMMEKVRNRNLKGDKIGIQS